MTPEEMLPLLRAIRDGSQTTPDVTERVGIKPAVAEFRLQALHRQGYLQHRWRKGEGSTWEVSGDGLRYLDAGGA